MITFSMVKSAVKSQALLKSSGVLTDINFLGCILKYTKTWNFHSYWSITSFLGVNHNEKANITTNLSTDKSFHSLFQQQKLKLCLRKENYFNILWYIH